MEGTPLQDQRIFQLLSSRAYESRAGTWPVQDLRSYQMLLGAPWFDLLGMPVYHPWRLFEWWYFFDAYAPDIFLRGGAIAAYSGFAGAMAAIAMSVWRARQSKLVTTYGSARWALPAEIHRSGLTGAAGAFLGRKDGDYWIPVH